MTAKYLFDLNTYAGCPKVTMPLSELEGICFERHNLYRIIAEAETSGLKRGTKNWSDYLQKEIVARKLQTYTILSASKVCAGKLKARRRDHIAHWLLSICYCKDQMLNSYFVQWELNWFFYLYKRTNKTDLQKFLQENQLVPASACVIEKLVYEEDFRRDCFNIVGETDYYKTHFSEVPLLVKYRKAFLQKGIAYFPESKLIHYVLPILSKQFFEQLRWNNRVLHNFMSDDRLRTLITTIPVISKSGPFHGITLENIDNFAKAHYPLCMQGIHERLWEQHHLKYDCKMQYGIFLYHLGLPYEDALTFWKDEFTKKMSELRFQRKYVYLFKHHYGTVGRKTPYKVQSCKNILSHDPGPGQYHGCPFKHWDKDRLHKKLEDEMLSSPNIRDIEDFVNDRSYQCACIKYYSVKRSIIREDVFENPNRYAAESYEVERKMDHYFATICEDC